MTCPECQGSGRQEITGFVCGSKSQAGRVEIRCSACHGTGTVADETPDWRELGRTITVLRQAHDQSAREFARAIDVSPGDLNEAEHGRINPLEIAVKASEWASSQAAHARGRR
jgi:DNA-binding XRE family transcriptional regulator